MNNKERLLDLYKRKKKAVSNMDGFQITKEIENTVFNILADIFKPHSITKFYPKEFGQVIPDCEMKVPALGKRKNHVFFEIKSGDLPEFELMQIEKIIRYLKVKYSERFHSLIVVARSFKDVQRIEEFCNKAYPSIVGFISAKTLVNILDFLEKKPELEEGELRHIFLRNLLSQGGILSPERVLKESIDRLSDQAKSISKLIESAEQTLSYWEEQASKLKQKKELTQWLKRLERELLWLEINETRQELQEWEELISNVQKIRSNLLAGISSIEARARRDDDLERLLKSLQVQEENLGRVESMIKLKLQERHNILNFEEKKALKLGSEIAVTKSSADLKEEINEISSRLANLADVHDDVESMYESYKKLFYELREKAEKVQADKLKFQDFLHTLKFIANK